MRSRIQISHSISQGDIERVECVCPATTSSDTWEENVILSLPTCEELVTRTCYHLLDSLVVKLWDQVREVPGSIPSQGPRHTKDVIKMVPGSSLV